MSDDGICYPGKGPAFPGGRKKEYLEVARVDDGKDGLDHFEIAVSPNFADEIRRYAIKNMISDESAIIRLIASGLEK